MSWDEGLAERVRELLVKVPGLVEKRLFGGLAFLHQEHLVACIASDALIARVGADDYAEALTRPHVRVMDVTGRPLTGFVIVDPPGLEEDDALADWLGRGMDVVRRLPPRMPSPPRSPHRGRSRPPR